jgi:hypothetical protein
LLAALARAPATRDELLRGSDAPDQLAVLLIELELAGRIVRGGDGRFQIVA